MDANKNLQNMKSMDDSWNAQDLATFRRYHTKDCKQYLQALTARLRKSFQISNDISSWTEILSRENR